MKQIFQPGYEPIQESIVQNVDVQTTMMTVSKKIYEMVDFSTISYLIQSYDKHIKSLDMKGVERDYNTRIGKNIILQTSVSLDDLREQILSFNFGWMRFIYSVKLIELTEENIKTLINTFLQ